MIDRKLKTLVHKHLASKNYREAHKALIDKYAAEAVIYIKDCRSENIYHLLRLFPIEKASEIFEFFSVEKQVRISHYLSHEELASIIKHMSHDERADLFIKLNRHQKEALHDLLPEEEIEDIKTLASYEEGSAGSIMTSEYITLTGHMTVKEALDKVYNNAELHDHLDRLYVVDKKHCLLGAIKLRNLITSPKNTHIIDLMEPTTYAANASDCEEEVSRKLALYNVTSLPVVDRKQTLIGIITHDDAIDVLERAATDDFHKLSSVGGIGKNLTDMGILALAIMYRKRIAWLVALVFTNVLSGAGLSHFEHIISSNIGLIFFLPLLIASAGNAGSQASTLMVRAMAVGDIVIKDWSRMVGRELLVALALGITMSFAVSLIGLYRVGPHLTLVISLTMVTVVLFGSLIGISLPFLLSRFNIDPAISSNPLITSICDVTGVVIYFSIATYFLS